MVQTYGLTHIALKVRDLDRSRLFYERVFGTRVMYQKDDFIQIQTPDARDIIVLEKSDEVLHNDNGIMHFGFRLKNAIDIETLVHDVSNAGGQIKEKGEFVPGEPYAFIYDPDGYEIEVWYEKIPPELTAFN
jgi:catechol 2,3-dioxygenase-like lactoylglutathione lyase family enzyme